jgi:ABC-type spermidine/putrescine transport system permease subunit II
MAGGLLAFTFSFDDYVLSAFTNGTTNTWPIVVYAAVRFGISPKINAIATIMIGVTVLLLLLAGMILRRSRPRAAEPGEGLGATLGLG